MPFRIGLSNILTCLKFAEEQGEVPKLPQEWWPQVESGTNVIKLSALVITVQSSVTSLLLSDIVYKGRFQKV